MKTMGCIRMRGLAGCLLVFLAAFALVSCGDDNPASPDPTPTDEKGEVSFEISTEGGTGSGTGTSPIEVAQGDTLGMTISQKSKYTDSEGTVFECEPNASICLFAELDTVYADKLEQLTAIQEKAEVQTSQEGQSPVTNRTLQKFQIGSQSVQFDLSYETYTYATADGNVEMPYAMPHEAVFGNAGASDEGERTRTVIRSISVKPLPQTRASVSDTTWYEVNAIFNLDVECMNTREASKQNLTFSVTYRGAVTTEIELSEPVKELSHTIQATGGTASTSSPFVANPGETMGLLFKQTSTYTDAYGNQLSCEPEARISLSTETDTLYVQTKEDLEGVPASQNFVFNPSGENPLLYSATQRFELGTQHLQLEMSYEIYTATDVENNEIEMPYLKQNATIPGAATVSELSTATGEMADTTFYEVRVPIKLETVYVGTADENVQTTEIVASYIGAIVTWKEEPELVKVEYRTGYVWEEAHDNLPLLYYAKVYRDRYYSNGEVFTDEFVDVGHPVESVSSIYPEGEVSLDIENGEKIISHPYRREEKDSISIVYGEAEVPNLDLLTTDLSDDRYTTSLPGTWEDYLISKLYQNEFAPIDASFCQQSWENCDMATGWYFKDIRYIRSIDVNYNGVSLWLDIRRYNLMPEFYDQYLAIDGKRIDFLKYQPQHTYNFTVEDKGNSRIYKYECWSKFMGKTFYLATVDTIYEKQ